MLQNVGLSNLPDKSGGLNGSTQHFLGVYSQESENLKFVVGVDLSAALLCSDPTGNGRLGLCSSGSIVVGARLCFRSSLGKPGLLIKTVVAENIVAMAAQSRYQPPLSP